MEFPGGQLRERREALGLSVRDVYRKLHVPVEYVVALEAGDIDGLPDECYAVGFARTYATFLELDANRYADTLKGAIRQVRLADTSARTVRLQQSFPWMQGVLTWAAIVGVVLATWMAYSLIVRPQADGTEDRVEAGTEELHVPDFEWEP